MDEQERLKRLKFNTAKDIQRSLTKINNMLLNKQIDPKYANAITLACNTILGTLKYSDQDRKLQELEELIDNMRQ